MIGCKSVRLLGSIRASQPVMPRPVSIQDDLILRAAREIFLEKGLEATTSEIAAKAGVSHGIIFKRFKTKQGLFQSAMREDSDWGGKIALLLNPKAGGRDVETTLIELGSLFVEKFLLIIPMLMMSWSNRCCPRYSQPPWVPFPKRSEFVKLVLFPSFLLFLLICVSPHLR